MSPLATALIYFGLFLIAGLIAKVAIGMWMKRNSADDLPDRHAARRLDRLSGR